MLLRIAMASMLLLLVSCSNEEETLKIKRDIANIQEQIYAIEKNQAELQQQMAEQLKAVNRKLDDRAAQADTADQIRTIKQDLSQYQALVHDLESRVVELKRSGARVSLGGTASTDGSATDDGGNGDSDLPRDPTSEPPSEVSGDVVEGQFNQALLDYHRGKYDVATLGFQDVLTNFPNSPYTESSHYYLGSCYFNAKEYQKAKDQFTMITSQFSQGKYVKQSMYYEGRCYYHLNQPSKAVLTLRELIDMYPNTQEAELAQSFLKRTGYER